MRAQKEPPGVVVGVYRGNQAWETAVGVSNTASGKALTTSDHFRIGSVTKTFVGTVILQMVDEGLITLDQKIDTILDGVPNGNKVTIRMLLNMTSGVPSYSENPKFIEAYFGAPTQTLSVADLLEYAYELPAEEPGTKIHYSNTNTILLGQVIEKLTNKSIAQNLDERVYRRLGLSETVWPTNSEMPAPFASGYDGDPPAWTPVDSTNYNPSWANAAGQLVSTLRDLKVYARALGTGSLISPEMQTERLKWVELAGPPDKKYGLAVGQTGGWTFHQGEIPGYNSIVAYLPTRDITVVALVNTSIVKDTNTSTPVTNLLVRISRALAPEATPTTNIE